MGIETLEVVDRDPEIINSQEDIETPLILLTYGDLYVLGQLWIRVLKTALVGDISLLPVVEAAAPAKPYHCPPKKPAPMKYTDLPLYTSPHYEYKDYVENIHSCPKAKTKLVQECLLPHVKSWRKCSQDYYCSLKCSLKEMKNEACETIRNSKREFKRMMRDPENLAIRRAIVLLGTTTGFLLGSGRNVSRRIFYTGVGALASGALCFPKETDEAFRTLSYHTAKAGLAFYNLLCGKEIVLRERLLCKEDLPPPPQLRRMNPCPRKQK
ncbi:uncharacterized protein LOC115440294 [Manduca sexta]|uniref:uncharacterized protein LOC115440294 n=1 Tax=Manduca sexta TaxID=7130 RepID=UPI0018905B9D|nr:uncharacterized protein LOC115440294 [Manduca sexta]